MPLLVVILVLVIYLMSSIKILAEYERGVIFRLGRLLPEAKGPGVILVFVPLDRMVRVSLRVDTIEVPPQDAPVEGGRPGVNADVGSAPVDTVLQRLPGLHLDPRSGSAPRGLVFRKPPDLRVRWDLG